MPPADAQRRRSSKPRPSSTGAAYYVSQGKAVAKAARQPRPRPQPPSSTVRQGAAFGARPARPLPQPRPTRPVRPAPIARAPGPAVRERAAAVGRKRVKYAAQATEVRQARRQIAEARTLPVPPAIAMRVDRGPGATRAVQQAASQREAERRTRELEVHPPQPAVAMRTDRGVGVTRAVSELNRIREGAEIAGRIRRVQQRGEQPTLRTRSVDIGRLRDLNALPGTGPAERAIARNKAQAAREAVAAAKAADSAVNKVEKKNEPEKPIKVAGISTHVKPSVARVIAKGLPAVGSLYSTAKALDATAKALEAPAETALKNLDRGGNAVRGEFNRDIAQHGVKQFLFGAPHKASDKELKDIRQTAKRHVQLKDETSGSDVLKTAGVKNKYVRAIGGFGVDVASSAATLPVGGIGSSVARAGEKAAVRAAAKGGRFARPVRAAAKGARAGAKAGPTRVLTPKEIRRAAARAGAKPVSRNASEAQAARATRAATRNVTARARRVAQGRALTLAERNRKAVIAAREAGQAPTTTARVAAKVTRGGKTTTTIAARRIKPRAGQGIGLRYAGIEIPGTRAATAAVGRGVRKIVRAKPAVTESERRAGRAFAQTERTARGGKEQAQAQALRDVRRAHKNIKPDEWEQVAQALDRGDIRSLADNLDEIKAEQEAIGQAARQAAREGRKVTPVTPKVKPEGRLYRAATDLRVAYGRTHKAERYAGVSAVRRPDDFLSDADRKQLQKSIAAQQREVKRSVQGAQRLHERGRAVAQRHGAVAEARHGPERMPGKLETRINVKADEALTNLRRHQARRTAAKNIPRRGRGTGVPITETHKAWLQRVSAYAGQHDLPVVAKHADELLAKAPKKGEVAGGYFPREFAGRAEQQAGVAATAAAPGGARVVRGGPARTATPATGGRARTDPRRLDIVQAEREAAGQEPFSTNVPLVTGSRVRSGLKAVTETDTARNTAAQGRRVTSTNDVRPGEKLYLLGTRGGKYGLHETKNVGRSAEREANAYHRAMADYRQAVDRARRSGQDPGAIPVPEKPKPIKAMPGGRARQPGQYYAIPEHTVQAMEEANRPMPALEANLFDKVTAGWKTATTYTPRFHLRNAIGDIQRLTEMPGNPLATLSKLPGGVKAARAVRQAERYRQHPGKILKTDPLNKATIKVAGEDMPVRDFVKLLREHKLLDVGRTQQERAEAALMRGGTPEEGKLLRGGLGGRMQGGPFGGHLGRTISVDAPNAIRATAFKAGLDMGLKPAAAADKAHEFFVDYTKLSARERLLLKRVFPFYTWTARSLPVTLANYATHPARYANLNNARNEWNQAVTGLSSDELAKQMKPFTRGNLPIVIPIGHGKDGKPRFAAVSASWPANLVQYVPGGIGPKAAVGEGGQIYKLGTGQLNWIAKLLVEGTSAGVTQGAGLNLSTAKSIENPDSPRVKAPSWAASLPPWAKKELLVDHKVDKVTGKTNVVWRGWAAWALKQGSIGLAGQAQQATDTAKAGRINTTPAKIAEFLGVTVEDLGPDIAKGNERIDKFHRASDLNRQIQQLPEGVGKDNPTPKWRRLRDELNALERELTPSKKPKAPSAFGGGGFSGSGFGSGTGFGSAGFGG